MNSKTKPAHSITTTKNGNKKKHIYYEETGPLGDYATWYENGQKQMEGQYLKSDREGYKTGILKIDQFWTPNDVQTVTDGNGYYDLTQDDGCERRNTKRAKTRHVVGRKHQNRIHFYREIHRRKIDLSRQHGCRQAAACVSRSRSQTRIHRRMDGFYRYVARNFRVPEIEGLKGKVFLGFTIEKDGSVDNITIVRSMGAAVDKEAYRVLAESPNWIPARSRGVIAAVKYSLPINIQSSN